MGSIAFIFLYSNHIADDAYNFYVIFEIINDITKLSISF